MKVGIDITPVIYEGTGVGTYTRELVRHLLPLDDKIHYTLFASTLRGQKKVWEYLQTLTSSGNFSFKIYPFPPLVTEMAWNKLHKFTIEKFVGPVDVFHAWDWQQPPAKSAKLVTTIHDLTTLKFPDSHRRKTIEVHRRRLEWVAKETSAIIADSEATRQDIVDTLKIDKNKIHTVYLAASEQFTNFRNQEPAVKNQEISRVRQKYNLPQKFVLSANSADPRKNTAKVIKASPLPVFALTGSIPSQDLPAIYAASEVFVFASLYEGFGLPVLEAMAVGCPVVTSDRGSLQEVAGDAAILIDPEDIDSITAGIKTVLGDKSQTLIKDGLAQAARFSWHQTAQQTLNVYKLLLAIP